MGLILKFRSWIINYRYKRKILNDTKSLYYNIFFKQSSLNQVDKKRTIKAYAEIQLRYGLLMCTEPIYVLLDNTLRDNDDIIIGGYNEAGMLYLLDEYVIMRMQEWNKHLNLRIRLALKVYEFPNILEICSLARIHFNDLVDYIGGPTYLKKGDLLISYLLSKREYQSKPYPPIPNCKLKKLCCLLNIEQRVYEPYIN